MPINNLQRSANHPDARDFRKFQHSQMSCMTPRSRMVITLGALVVSMTATSALLDYLDPTPMVRAGELPYDEIIDLAREAVHQGVSVGASRWSLVALEEDGAASREALLSATPNQADWHFHVSPDGRPVRSAAWGAQRAYEGMPHAVTIRVARNDHDVTPAQWVCIRALLTFVSQAAGHGNQLLPLQITDSLRTQQNSSALLAAQQSR